MISSTRIFAFELTGAVLLVGITSLLLLLGISPQDCEALSTSCQNLQDFNIAVTIAFLINMVTNRSFQYKGRNLSLIARHSVVLVLGNSLLLSLYPFFGAFKVAVVLPTILGNLVQFWNISKNILGVVR